MLSFQKAAFEKSGNFFFLVSQLEDEVENMALVYI
jgi:hypothetical protein